MRKKLLVSTAALLAGIAMASAQEMPSGKQSGGGAQMEHSSAGQDRGGQAQRGAQDQSKQGQSQQRSQRQEKRDQTTGQAQRGQADQSKQGQHDQSMQSIGKQGQRDRSMQGQSKQGQRDQGMQSHGKQGQAQRSQGQPQRDQTTGQGQRDQSQSSTHSQRGQPHGQTPQRQQSQQTSPQSSPQGQTQQGQTSRQGQAQQGQDQQGQFQGQAGGSVTLSSEQRTRIQRTVLASSNVPRVNNVNFSLSVGTAVPSSVRVVDVSPALIEINPQWRGHQYFVVHDDIVIVDRSHKIVAVVPTASSGGAQLHNNNRSGALSTLNLTEEQTRELQIALKQKGFNIGRPDGRLGPRTTQALIAFQRRQQGFEASGRPDSQTVTALGLSNVTGAQGGAQGAGQSSTTGQAPARQNQGASQPPTSGQGDTSQHQAPAQQNQDANQPSTSGQGSATTQHQGPAQPTQPPANQNQHNSGSK